MILDLLMHGMDGFEFLAQFRRTRGSHGTPVIVWTAKDLTQDDQRRLQRSAQAIVQKGADMERVAAIFKAADLDIKLFPMMENGGVVTFAKADAAGLS